MDSEEESSFPYRYCNQRTCSLKYVTIHNLPPVYVISRLHNLANLIRELAQNILKHDISVIPVDVPESTDYLTDSAVASVEIAVIDPVLLQFNYIYMPSLKWAHCTWAGIENLFQTMKEKPNFIITRHAGKKFCNLMAEYVLGNVLSFERNSLELWKNQNQKRWLYDVESYAKCRTLDQLTITILGVGNMGQAIGTIFKERGSKLYGFSRTSSKKDAFCLFDKVEHQLNEEILRDADYIINTLPSSKSTVGILNANTFSYCQKKPVFVNVGRGDVIDEEELFEAYKDGFISGVILDVFKKEPLPENSILWNIKGIITPHCSAVSKPEHVAENFLHSLACYKQRVSLPNMVDWEAGY